MAAIIAKWEHVYFWATTARVQRLAREHLRRISGLYSLPNPLEGV